MKETIRKLFHRFKRFITYGLVGCVNTLVDFLVFTLMLSVVGLGVKPAQSIGYLTGVLTSFILNRNITFKGGKNKIAAQVSRFVVVNAVSYLVSTNLIAWLVERGLNAYIAKIAITVVVMLINYFGYKVLVFGVKDNEDSKKDIKEESDK